MAISQARMLALIAAADDFRAGYQKLHLASQDALAMSASDGDWHAAFQYLFDAVNNNRASPASVEAILIEKAHYKQFAARNDRVRMRRQQILSGGESRRSNLDTRFKPRAPQPTKPAAAPATQTGLTPEAIARNAELQKVDEVDADELFSEPPADEPFPESVRQSLEAEIAKRAK